MRLLYSLSFALLQTLIASSFAQPTSSPNDSVGVTSHSTNQSHSANNAPLDLNTKKVFGVTLGRDTMSDIKPIVTSSQVVNYGYLSAIGKEIFISDSLSTTNDAIKFIEFSTDDGKFTAVTLNEIIIELQVHGEYESWVGDQSLIPRLRAAFDKKYKRMKSIKLVENDTYLRTAVLYELWKEESGDFTVVLKEMRPKVTDRAACLSYVNVLRNAGGMVAILESRCKGMADPEFKLFYRVDAEYARAYTLLKDAVDKKGKVANESKRREVLKY